MLDSISGNETAKRALQISLAGKHHMLFIGTPGSGKSLLAKSSKELLPGIDKKLANIFQLQQIDQSSNTSKSSSSSSSSPLYIKPFREPHHTSSYTEIIGNRMLPGEIVLAHGGVLFLDELSEFNRRVLESLRQPLENKYIQRNQGELVPTDFLLIACMNPCDCGHYQSKQKRCVCARSQIEKYRRKMNSPLFQRFDMCVYVQTDNKVREIIGLSGKEEEPPEKSHTHTNIKTLKGRDIVKNILKVRRLQTERHQTVARKHDQVGNVTSEATELKSILLEIDLENFKNLREKECGVFEEIRARFSFSKREEMSLLRVARTIADLDKSKNILEKHLFEALSYRYKN
jgi:magnesium chelatase family protein